MESGHAVAPGTPGPAGRIKVLRLDHTGQPAAWLSWQQAAVLYSLGKVAWTAGEQTLHLHGGTNRVSGLRSVLEIHSIVATHGRVRREARRRKVPPLSNRALFLRDGHLCLYCGGEFAEGMLTRDHVTPLSQGGRDCWSNVLSACRACNTRKGGRTPEEAGMPLLAVPFVPNYAEYLVLSNRRILADQMAFLKARFRKGSRLLRG
ncbi:MAG: HNH endonuclease [Gammaproteobacteria bacterium]|nr:HNH endonuclease [Gammaproteobacteria bacterium]